MSQNKAFTKIDENHREIYFIEPISRINSAGFSDIPSVPILEKIVFD